MKYNLFPTYNQFGKKIYKLIITDKNEEIAELIIDNRCFVISSYVKPSRRNKGVGTRMYYYALKKLGKLGTWGCTTPAQQIWNKLAKKKNVVKKHNYLQLY